MDGVITHCTDCEDTAPFGMGNGKCRHCKGTGQARKLGRPKHRGSSKCHRCKGTKICQTCKGFGVLP